MFSIFGPSSSGKRWFSQTCGFIPSFEQWYFLGHTEVVSILYGYFYGKEQVTEKTIVHIRGLKVNLWKEHVPNISSQIACLTLMYVSK